MSLRRCIRHCLSGVALLAFNVFSLFPHKTGTVPDLVKGAARGAAHPLRKEPSLRSGLREQEGALPSCSLSRRRRDWGMQGGNAPLRDVSKPSNAKHGKPRSLLGWSAPHPAHRLGWRVHHSNGGLSVHGNTKVDNFGRAF